MQTLVKIQELDLEVDALQARAKSVPLESAQLDDELADAQNALAAARSRLKELELQERHDEGVLEEKNALLNKYDTQLFTLKSNKEYKAMLTEMDLVKADISSIEDRILELMTDIDYVNSEIASAERALEEEEEKVRRKKAEFNEELVTIKANMEEYDQQREELVPRVDEDLYALYERIREAKGNGCALVPVKNDSCSGCHMHITPQVINELIAGDRIITCQSCSRILYWPEEAEE